jgi:AraC-like DNA-binding protein
LKNSGDSVSQIALSLGYESESAFSKAFKRVMGYSPRQYARGGDLANHSSEARETIHSVELGLAMQ